MRILFYVEPFPVRNSMTHYALVARRAAALCVRGAGVELRVFGNSDTLRALGGGDEEANDFVRESLIWPTEDEDAFFRSQLVPWETEGISLWSACMRGEPASSPYRATLERIRAEFPFDVIVYWGENGFVKRFACDYGLAHIGLELGCSRSPYFDSYVFDPAGTNGAALPPRLSIEQIETIVGGVETSAEECLLGFADDAERAIYDDRFSMLPPRLAEKAVQGGRKIAFLALQLFDDANLLRFSEYKDMRDVVLSVVPKLANAGYAIIVKPHPMSFTREGSSQECAIARSALSRFEDRVVWLDDLAADVSNGRLLQVADLVVTVNSSVGFEALYFDKTVTVLGDAVYKPTGVFPSLDEALSGAFDRAAYLRNIGLLRTFFFDAYLASEKWIAEPHLFAHRVSTLASIQRRFPDDAFAMANALYAAFSRSCRFLGSKSPTAGSNESDFGKFVAPKPGGSSPGGSPKVFGFRQGVNFQSLLIALKRASGAHDASGIKLWLQGQWQESAARLNVLRLLTSVDVAWYHKLYPDVKAHGISPIKHFNNLNEQWRIPSPMIEEKEYSTLPAPRYLHALFNVLDSSNLTFVPSESGLSREESESVRLADIELEKLAGRKPRPYAVVAHLYYDDLVDSLLDRLASIREEFDLIVTLPLWGHRVIAEKTKRRFEDAICLPLPNRGRDVGPFLHVLPTLVERGYRAALKIQTKKGFYQGRRLVPRLGTAWREYSWDCLAGGEQAAAQILKAFERDDALSMVGPAELLLRTSMYPEAIDAETARSIGVEQFGEDDMFFAGTMFWMRPAAFSSLGSGRFAIENFSANPENAQGELEHMIERLFGHLARKEGRRMAAVGLDVRSGEFRLEDSLKPNVRPLVDVMTKFADEYGCGSEVQGKISS